MILIYDYFCEKWYEHPNFKGKVFDSKTDWYWKNVLVQLKTDICLTFVCGLQQFCFLINQMEQGQAAMYQLQVWKF